MSHQAAERSATIAIGSGQLVLLLGSLGVLWSALLFLRPGMAGTINGVGRLTLGLAAVAYGRSARWRRVSSLLRSESDGKPRTSTPVLLGYGLALVLVAVGVAKAKDGMTAGSCVTAAITISVMMLFFQSHVVEYLLFAFVVLGAGVFVIFNLASWATVLLVASVCAIGMGLSLEKKWQTLAT